MNYIIRGAKDLGIQPLCEGVECEEHYDFLKWIECEKAQGYYFGKPLPLDLALENIEEKGYTFEKYDY